MDWTAVERIWRAPKPFYVAPLALFATLGWTTAGMAQDASPVDRPRLESAGQLADICAGKGGLGSSDQQLAFCDGFIVGSGSLYAALRQADAVPAWACADPVPSVQTIRTRFVQWIMAHPDARADAPVDGFWRAMNAEFPCSASEGG